MNDFVVNVDRYVMVVVGDYDRNCVIGQGTDQIHDYGSVGVDDFGGVDEDCYLQDFVSIVAVLMLMKTMVVRLHCFLVVMFALMVVSMK